MKKIFLSLLLIANIFAVDKTGTTAAKFLSTSIGSKAIGMGGAFCAVSNDGSSMYWNPAGVAFHNLNVVFVNHANWIADISFDYFGFTTNLGKNNYLGINVTSVTMDDMEVTRYGNENTGETFSSSSYAFGATYALNMTDNFSLGINGKYIQENIANSFAKGLALDIGTLFQTPFGFTLGTSISNFGPKMNMTGDDLIVPVDIDETIGGNNESVTGYLSTDDFDLPLILRVGISNEHSIGSIGRITWALDTNSPNDNSNYVNVGIECGILNDLITMGFGANSLLMTDREKEFSYGFGIHPPKVMNSKMNIVYTVESMTQLGQTHHLSFQISR